MKCPKCNQTHKSLHYHISTSRLLAVKNCLTEVETLLHKWKTRKKTYQHGNTRNVNCIHRNKLQKPLRSRNKKLRLASFHTVENETNNNEIDTIKG